MPRLKSRQKFPPGGFVFYQPQTRWQSTPNASFDSIVNDIIMHRRGQPAMTEKAGLSTDYETVSNELDAFNAAIAKRQGWTDYYSEGGAETALPFPSAPPSPPPTNPGRVSAAAASVKAIWQGVKTLNDWIDSGEPAVAPELSARRAEVCASCPKNAAGSFESWFTRPASEAMRRQLERVQDRKLTTSFDDKLNICQVCFCPMRLKVHVPIVAINAHLSDETRSALKAVTNPSGGCWLPKEIWPT